MALQLERTPTTTPASGPGRTSAPIENTLTPVKWWAAAGAIVVAVMTYTYAAWILSGDAVRTPTGADDAPRWMQVVLKSWEVIGVATVVVLLYWFVLRPWRRERRLSTDGAFVLAFVTIHFQDPFLNYTQVWATYNATFVNWGNWAAHLPGWISPTGHLFAEPLLWTMPAYVYAVLIIVKLVSWVMRETKARRPETGVVGLLGAAFVFSMILDFAIESLFMRLGIYTYPGSIEWLTIFKGNYYQFPIYEVFFAGAMFTAFGALRYFQNDRGETVAERGVDTLRVSSGKKDGIRVLAIVGALHLAFLGLYNIPIQFIALHSSEWPADITDRSYFMNGMCGEGTEYSCGSPDVPVPRPNSAHVGPDGDLVGP